jgi:hypothetical protein
MTAHIGNGLTIVVFAVDDEAARAVADARVRNIALIHATVA